MKILKKAVSMIVAVCLMIGITNIPVYAGAVAISPTKTTDAVLSQPYYTPSQIVKKASSKPKTTVTKKKAKIVSLTSQIIKKYTKKGLTVLKTLANKEMLSLKAVYNAFVKMGVTKAQINKVANTLLKLMNKGETFKNCAALAVSKYLGISRELAAVQNLAAYISIDTAVFLKNNSNGFNGTISSAELKTLQKGGKEKANEYQITFKDFKSSLKVGQKALVHVNCDKVGDHVVTVVKEKNNCFGVYDVNVNNGNKVIYTSSQFNKLMNGTIKNGYYSALSTQKLYVGIGTKGLDVYREYEGIDVITDSKEISKKVAAFEFKNSITNKLKKQNIDLINKQLQTKGLSKLAKTWLQEAKKIINKVAKGDYINQETGYINKEEFLRKSLTALKEIEKEKFSTISLIKHCEKEPYIDYESTTVFYSLKKVLKKDFTYKMYSKYGENGIKIINYLSKQFNLSQNAVFEHFQKFKADNIAVLLIAADNDLSKIIDKNFLNNNKFIKYGFENEKKAIFQLISDAETIAA